MSKNYFKKTLAGIFALAIVASATPLAPYTKVLDSISITASAAETYDGLVYEIVDDTITITGYVGDSSYVEIPAEIDGKPVTVIGEEAFRETGIQTIVLNEGLERIDDYAFWESSITSVTFPKSLRFIGQGAFMYCEKLDFVRFLNSDCEMGIDAYCPFIDWENGYDGCFLKTVYCPTGSSKYYCDYGFNGNHEGCDGAWTFVEESPIPDSTLRWSLDENGVMTISGDDEAFPDFFDEVNPMPIVWCDRKDEVKEVVFDTPKLKNLGSAALVDFENLTSVKLPETLTSIGDYAFVSCFSLSSVTIPDSVKSIGYGAFGNCSALTQIVIPDTATSIGELVFYGCSALTEITIPDSVKSIGANAFKECPDLKNVYYTGSESDWESVSIDDGNDALKNATITYVKAAQKILDSELTWEIDENGVLTISGDDTALPAFLDSEWNMTEWCGDRSKIKKVVFNTPNLTSIGRGAFYEFENLESIELPNSLIMIGDAAFERCTSLEKIEFPNTLSTIGDEAFYGCEKLESIELPDSLTTLGWGAFGFCHALKSIKLSAFMTSIPEGAFMYAAIESFTIPAGITEIGVFAFGGCPNLKAINVEADNSNYCSVDGVLFNKDKTALMQYPIGNEDAAYTVPDTVTSILGGAFCYAESLTDITLPDFLTTIEDEAFGGTKIKSITIPNTVTKIGSWTFGECEDLTSVIIPDSVTEIGSYAFMHCSSLADVTLSDSLKNIGEYAFAECPLLTDITIPASVTNVGEGVFEGSGLKSATFECDDADAIANFNPDEGCYIFYGCTDLETIYVPAGCADSYKNSDGYKAALCDYIDLIQEMPIAAKGYSVSYNGDITINFHYLLSDSCKNGYVIFSDGTQVSASDAVKEDANGYFVFPISMPAKNMYDEITAQFYDENDVAIGNAVTFDLETYMDKVKAYDPNYSDFVDSFLEYGKQAAAYFGVTGAPAGKTYSDSDFASISNTLEANYASTDNMGDTFVGATLLLKSTPKLRLYYSETFTGAKQNELNPNLFYTEKEISPVKFGTEDLNGYYVYNYIYKAMNSNDASLKKLCAALYNMSKAIPTVG